RNSLSISNSRCSGTRLSMMSSLASISLDSNSFLVHPFRPVFDQGNLVSSVVEGNLVHEMAHEHQTAAPAALQGLGIVPLGNGRPGKARPLIANDKAGLLPADVNVHHDRGIATRGLRPAFLNTRRHASLAQLSADFLDLLGRQGQGAVTEGVEKRLFQGDTQ